MLGFSSALCLSLGEQFSSDDSSKLCLSLVQILPGTGKKRGLRNLSHPRGNCRFSSWCWRNLCGREKVRARSAEDEAALGAQSRGKAAAAQLPHTPPLLFPSHRQSLDLRLLYLLSQLCSKLWQREQMLSVTWALQKITPDQLCPHTLLLTRRARADEKQILIQKDGSSSSCWAIACAILWEAALELAAWGGKRLKYVFYQQSRIFLLLFHSLLCAHIRA